MIKVLLLVNTFVLIVNGIPAHGELIDENACRYSNSVWGSENDGSKFYICSPMTIQFTEQSCPEGKFFVRNKVAAGCIPYDHLHMICDHPSNIQPCSEANLLQPQIGYNPSEMFICLAVDEEPTKVTCAEGKAFANHNGRSGCYPVAEWREITGCTAF